MALNYKVNGHFGRKPPSRLDDPERVRKDLESQRRITRLQQVRVASKDWARTIRENVTAEKKRQLENLERVKLREQEAWRENVLAKKHQDYRSSIFHVGAAHRAAREENHRIEQERQERIEKMKSCRKQAAKRSIKSKSTSVQLIPTAAMNVNAEGRALAGTQTPTLQGDDKENRLLGGCKKSDCKGTASKDQSKRKRCCCASTDEDESSSSDDDDSSILPAVSPTGNSRLQKTPPVILDVDIDDSLSEAGDDGQGLEINDRFMQTNRKFSHVVRPSQDVSPERTESQRRPRFTQITDLVRRTETRTLITNDPVDQREQEVAEAAPPAPTKALPRSPTKTVIQVEALAPATKPTVRKEPGSPKKPTLGSRQQQPAKRVGLKTDPPAAKVIDPGILRSQKGKTQQATLPKVTAIVQEPAPTTRPSLPQEPLGNLRPIPQQTHFQQHMPEMPNPPMPQAYPLPHTQPYIHIYQQPGMQPYALPYSMPYHMAPPPHPMYAQHPTMPNQPPVCVTAPPSTVTQSTASTTTISTQQGPSRTVQSTGRVQFYDHGNKYKRTYVAPTQSVECIEKDPSQMTAMDHARVETQLKELREHELDKLRKISHERGQKALQREQIRRDCAELTEKLDALAQKDGQLLPSDANFIASHRYADVAARREQKMNEAMEEMLLRPAIITCPEVGTRSGPTTSNNTRGKYSAPPMSLNLGERPRCDDLGSNESCCTILLDYAEDQSKQLRSDIRAEKGNSEKSRRLRGLLDRIENIRGQLLGELKAGEDAGTKGDNAQEMIDNIRQERADILAERTKSLDERESDLQQKEAILDRRLKDFYKDVKNKKSEKEDVEIIIKVKSDGTVKQCLPRHKSKPIDQEKTNANGKEIPSTENSTPPEEPAVANGGRVSAVQEPRHNSFDSNSTAYRSLPPVSYKSFNPSAGTESASAPRPLDPLIAQYIDHLLSLNRECIENIGVSTSDLTTPSPSIINVSDNEAPEKDKNYKNFVSEQRMQQVENFISENRSFINELEHSLRCQKQQQREQQVHDRESSIQAFDRLWHKRFSSNQKDGRKDTQERGEERRTNTQERGEERRKNTQERDEEVRKNTQERDEDGRKNTQERDEEVRKKNNEKDKDGRIRNNQRDLPRGPQEESKRMAAQENRQPMPAQGERDRRQRQETRVQYEKVTSVGDQQNFTSTHKSKSKATSETTSNSRKERFEELTESCTARIAELTALIVKVREEKQRLVEVTLTSNSDGERQSTEYFDLPNGQRQTRGRTLSDRSDSQTASLSEGLPLQKHKPTAASRDSGIADSRPLTAQGQVTVDVEPISLPSSTQSRNRGRAPPATIRRYSPQLDEEDLGHELSTITEVETPGQSHIVAATPVPKPFPNFEQYARELQLDLADLDADESQQLQSDFNDLVQDVHQRIGGVDYREFPSISAYMHDITTTKLHMVIDGDRDEVTQGPAEMMRQLRVVDMQIREFPKRKDYMKRLAAKQPADQREFIDSASLDQMSSDSFDVERELRQRKILKTSFRRGNLTDTTLISQEVASSTRRESVAPPGAREAPNESGIDPLSRSYYSTDSDHRDARNHSRRKHRSDGSTASTSPERQPRWSRQRGGERNSHRSGTQDASQIGKSLDIRKFLTRELLKHCLKPDSTSAETSDESLRDDFLQSILHSFSHSSDSLTPGVGESQATGGTNDRHKTSTPVGSFVSLPHKSGSIQSTGTALFSGESRLSLVNYPDGSPPVPYEQKSKQSTNHHTSPSKMQAHRRSPRK